MSVRQSVQTLVLSALQASDASSSEAAHALNSLLEAERSLLPEIAEQLRRSNKITDEVLQMILASHVQEQQTVVSCSSSADSASSFNNNNNSSNHEQCIKVESENRDKLKQYYEDRIAKLEEENGKMYAELTLNTSSSTPTSTSISMEQHALVLAQLEAAEEQCQRLLETCQDAVAAKEATKNRTNDEDEDDDTAVDSAACDDINLRRQGEVLLARNRRSTTTASSSSPYPQPGWTKEAWFAAYQQLDENVKSMLSSTDASKLTKDLSDWKDRAANAVNRVATLETDVNSLRFVNGVLQEQLASLVVFSEKVLMVKQEHQQQKQSTPEHNPNDTSSLAVRLPPPPPEIQKILRLAQQQQQSSSSLKTSDLLSDDAVSAAFRTVENVGDFSSASFFRASNNNNNNNERGGFLDQIHLGSFTFTTVKDLVERFCQLSQALYVQELDDIVRQGGKKELLDKQKRHRSEDVLASDNTSTFFSGDDRKTTVFVATDDRSCQTDSSHFGSHSSKSNGKSKSVSQDGADDDDNDNDITSDRERQASGLTIDSDSRVFNALRQITLNLETGFASASHAESGVNTARLAAATTEIDSLSKQLEASQSLLREWKQKCQLAEGREKLAKDLVDRLQSQVKEQAALEVQAPMLREIPGILTRFESALATIAANAEADKDEAAAKEIAGDSMKKHIESLEHLLGRMQIQHDAFAQLSSASATSTNNNNNNNNNNLINNNNNSSNRDSNNNTTNSNTWSLQNRIADLEREIQSQGQDLEMERNRTIEQLERMYQAEEQARQLRNEVRELKSSALSAEQAQSLRDEIDHLELRNATLAGSASQTERELRNCIEEVTATRDSLLHQVNESESKNRALSLEVSRAINDRNKASAELNAAYAQVTLLSRSLQESSTQINDMAAQASELRSEVSTLRTALLSEATVRDHFNRIFPNDSAGAEALARVAHLDQELKSKSDEVRSLAHAKHQLENQLSSVQDQLQESESERVTSRMRAATAESALKKFQERSQSESLAAGNELSFLRQDCLRLASERDAAIERSSVLAKHVDTLSQDQLSAAARLYGLSETRSFTLQAQEMHQRNQALQAQIDDSKKIVVEREKELDITQTSLNQECAKSRSLQNQLRQASDVEVSLRERISSVEASLSSTQEALDRVRGDLKSMTTSRDDLSNEIVQLEQRVRNLSGEKEDLEDVKAALEKKVEELRKDVEDRDQLVAVAREAVASGGSSFAGSSSSATGAVFRRISGNTASSSAATSNSNNIGRFTNAVSH